MTECSVSGCASPQRARGWCNLHYRRWQRSGDPLKVAFERGDPEKNFWAKVRRSGDTDCWLWTGSISADGYGRLLAGPHRLAHRYSYTLTKGEIPDGLELDHTCHSASGCEAAGRSCHHRRCVNPSHLELVTHGENHARIAIAVNRRRGIKVAALQADKTHCPAGHEYTTENTYVDKRGSRNCRTCAAERSRQRGQTEAGRAYQREYQREYQRRRRAALKQQNT